MNKTDMSKRRLLKATALAGLSGLAPATIANSVSANTKSGNAMLHKSIPKSGVRIPVVGIGTNRYGVGSDLERQKPLKEVLRRFAQLGDGVVDTAPRYGTSEDVIGAITQAQDIVGRFFMASKCNKSGGKSTRAQVQSSLSKLNVKQLDLVAIHSLHEWQNQLPELREMQSDGLIRHIGVTTSRGDQHEELAEVMRTEELDFVQLNYSLLDHAAEDSLLSIARDKGIAVMVNLPFARGQYFSRVKDQALPDWTSDFSISSWAQYALKYIVSHPAVTCVIPGTTKLRHLEDNLLAGHGDMPAEQARQKMKKYFQQL